MNKFLPTIIAFFVLATAQAQNKQEYEIIMNGKKQQVAVGKQYKFVTPKGDTVIYQLNDIPEKTVKDQPKINQNTGQTATNVKEEMKEETKTMTDIEKLKEQARQKARGETETKPEEVKNAPEKKESKTTEDKKVVEKKETKTVAEEKVKTPVKEEKKPAAGKVEAEEKKDNTAQKSKFEFKKYYVADQNITASNIASKDTLKFITTDLSVYKDFPSLQFGTNNNLAMCYDYVVMAYHGYDQELIDKHTTRYKVCQVGSWSESKKTAEVYLDTKQGKTKVRYAIAQLDEKNLVLVKR